MRKCACVGKRSRTNGNAAVMAVRSRRGTMPPVSGSVSLRSDRRSVVINRRRTTESAVSGTGRCHELFNPNWRGDIGVCPSPSKIAGCDAIPPADESIEAELSRDFSELAPLFLNTRIGPHSQARMSSGKPSWSKSLKTAPLTETDALSKVVVWLVDLKSTGVIRKICDEAASGYRAGRNSTAEQKDRGSPSPSMSASAIGRDTEGRRVGKSRRSGPGGQFELLDSRLRVDSAIHTWNEPATRSVARRMKQGQERTTDLPRLPWLHGPSGIGLKCPLPSFL